MARVVDARGLGSEHGQFQARERARRQERRVVAISLL